MKKQVSVDLILALEDAAYAGRVENVLSKAQYQACLDFIKTLDPTNVVVEVDDYDLIYEGPAHELRNGKIDNIIGKSTMVKILEKRNE